MEATEELLPLDTKSFIKLIHDAHPARCKIRGESEEDHQRYAGKRELIDEILSLWEEHYGESPLRSDG